MVLDKATTRYVALMITHKCNLNCVYCYEKFKSTQTMDIDNAKKYIVNIFEERKENHGIYIQTPGRLLSADGN